MNDLDDEEERPTHTSLPRLTRSNWNSEFKNSFKNYALTCGEAGNIILTGVDENMRRPVRDMPRDEGGDGAAPRLFPDNDRGDKVFAAYEKKYRRLMEGKKRLMAKLLMSMDKDITTSLMAAPGYQAAYDAFNILELWRMTEQVVVGRGAISAYTLIARLLKLKQGSDPFAKFDKEFKDLVADLNAQGDAEQVSRMLFNSLYILALNQDQFKDKLARVYGEREWPRYIELSAELYTYAEATERMSAIRKGDNEGQISAFVVDRKQEEDGGRAPRKCYGCGSVNHLKPDCPKRDHVCTICGRRGHLEIVCHTREKKEQSPPYIRVKPSGQGEKPKKDSGQKPGNRTMQRKKVLQDVMAQLLNVDDSDDGEFGMESGDLLENEDDENVFNVGCITCNMGEDAEGQTVIANSLKTGTPHVKRLIIDSGCRGAHVVQDPAMLEGIIKAEGKRPTVQGISGHKLTTISTGHFKPGIEGRALVTPGADESLLSLMELVKHTDACFTGNKDTLTISSKDGHAILTATNTGDDFWSCDPQDLVSGNKAYFQSSVSQLYLSAEERRRAAEAYDLCAKLRHPGDQAVIAALDGGCFGSIHLTAQDFRNARRIFGACLACAEGKMRAPSAPVSQSEPARAVGEHLHIDILPFSDKSLGGNTCLLFAVDEKSSYYAGIPMSSKSSKNVLEALLAILAEFNAHGHKVIRITMDDERVLATLKIPCGKLGVQIAPTPAGLHEKRVERAVQTVKNRRRAMLAGLPYELPRLLECESYLDAITWCNRTPNTTTGDASPYQLVTGQKSFLPKYSFGQVGLFYSPQKAQNQRAEWGIFVAYGPPANYYRIYLPLKKGTYSKHRFSPQGTYPIELGLVPRLRQPQRDVPTSRLELSARNFDVQTGAPLIQRTPEHPSLAQEGVGSGDSDNGSVLNDSHQDGVHVDTTDSCVQESVSPKGARGSEKCQDEEGDLHRHTDSDPVSEKEQVRVGELENVMKEFVAPNFHPKSQREEAPARTIEPGKLSVSGRPQRSTVGNWRDGPAKERYSNQFQTAADAKLARITKAVLWRDLPDDIKAMKTSLKSALKQPDRRSDILNSIFKEIDNLEAPGVLKPILRRDIPEQSRQHVIGVYMFHREKFRADGSFEKDKTRIVLLSNRRDPATIGDTASPTVNPISVLTQLNLAAVEKSEVAAYDIKGAFLLTPMREGNRMFIKISGDVLKYWLERHPDRRQMVDNDGCLYFEILRYIYSLHEAPHEFNNMLNKKLLELGFKRSAADLCMYVKKVQGGYVRASVHVDDILLTYPDNGGHSSWFESKMEEIFPLVKHYNNLSYLGMQIKRLPNGDITVDQRGYLESILQKYQCDKVSKAPSTPANDHLFDSSGAAEPCEPKKYLSLIMSLMYLARYTRPDILMPITYLATKCKNPSLTDWRNLMHILYYLAGSRTEGLHYYSNRKFAPSLCADASHHLYPEEHGQIGFLIMNGSSPVGYRSGKIRLNNTILVGV